MSELYDIVFHLVGKQRIPNLMGVLHIPGKNMFLLKQKNILLTIFIHFCMIVNMILLLFRLMI